MAPSPTPSPPQHRPATKHDSPRIRLQAAYLYSTDLGIAVTYANCGADRPRCHGGLWLTDDLGEDWRNITPDKPTEEEGGALRPFFIDAKHGWVTFDDCTMGNASLSRTTNGGRTWRTTRLDSTSCSAGSGLVVGFVDPTHGWMTEIEASGGSSHLTSTHSRGVTWRKVGPLPSLADPTFFDLSNGWLSGHFGAASGVLYATQNGGRHWRQVFGSSEARRANVLPGLPVLSGGTLVLAETVRDGNKALVRFLSSTDGGFNWTAITTLNSHLGIQARDWPFGGWPKPIQVSVVDTRVWWVILRSRVWVTTDGGGNWTSNAIPGSGNLRAIDGSTAWVEGSDRLFATTDGGETWRNITPSRNG